MAEMARVKANKRVRAWGGPIGPGQVGAMRPEVAQHHVRRGDVELLEYFDPYERPAPEAEAADGEYETKVMPASKNKALVANKRRSKRRRR